MTENPVGKEDCPLLLLQVGPQLTIVVHRVIWLVLAGGSMEHSFRACVSRATALLGRRAFTRGAKQPL